MLLTADLTSDEETTLSAEAESRGLPVEPFVRSVLRGAAGPPLATVVPKRRKPLPLWPGKVIGDLGREEIYEDVGSTRPD